MLIQKSKSTLDISCCIEEKSGNMVFSAIFERFKTLLAFFVGILSKFCSTFLSHPFNAIGTKLKAMI